MKGTMIKIFWGAILISLGGLSLAGKLGYIDVNAISIQGWSLIFACFSLAFLLSYFISGVRNWGWLFPALMFAALALVIKTSLGNMDNPLIASAILLSVGLPFYVGYAVNRNHRGLLIPAWILTVVSLLLALTVHFDANVIASMLMYGVALPFLVVFLYNHAHKWALLTASLLAVLGTMPLIDLLPNEDLAGPIVMFLFVLPFLVMFFSSQKNWWALIPAGFFASIGLVAALNNLLPNDTYFLVGKLEVGIYTGVLFMGIALTFGILWLLRASRPTAWAIYPAIGCLIISLLTAIFGQKFEDILPSLVLLIIGGGMILGALFKQRGVLSNS